MNKFWIILLYTQLIYCNNFKEVAQDWHKAVVFSLDDTDSHIVRNWLFLKAYHNMISSSSYEKIKREFDEQSKSDRMHALTPEEFEKTNIGRALREIKTLADNYFEGERKLLYLEMYNLLKR